MSHRRVLITGGHGQLASDLASLLAARSEVIAPSRGELDVADATAVATTFEQFQPDLVLNCAAFHNVEVCEREADQAFAVNVTAVKRLGELCDERGAKLVHVSTNYVFDGRSDAPYDEWATPAPESMYAISKLAGEHAALAYCPAAIVVRTGGLYGLHGSESKGGNFVTRMLARAREHGALKMVADQRLSPTFTADLAAAIVEAVDLDAAGILHLTSSGDCSWFEFTKAIMEIAGIEVRVEPVATTRAPGAARRPLNAVLARTRTDAAGLTALPHWRAALLGYMTKAGENAGERTDLAGSLR